jgi:hypothetical protein
VVPQWMHQQKERHREQRNCNGIKISAYKKQLKAQLFEKRSVLPHESQAKDAHAEQQQQKILK